MFITQLRVSSCYVRVVRTQPLYQNGEGTFLILLCLLNVTQSQVYITQVSVDDCNIRMIRAEIFQMHAKRIFIVLSCYAKLAVISTNHAKL